MRAFFFWAKLALEWPHGSHLMSPDSPNHHRRNVFKGSAGLIIAVGVVVAVCIAFPAYRWFILISVGIGVVAAGILTLWHRLHPLKEDDIEKKRPLGLD